MAGGDVPGTKIHQICLVPRLLSALGPKWPIAFAEEGVADALWVRVWRVPSIPVDKVPSVPGAAREKAVRSNSRARPREIIVSRTHS